jgi:hypothetical protein
MGLNYLFNLFNFLILYRTVQWGPGLGKQPMWVEGGKARLKGRLNAVVSRSYNLLPKDDVEKKACGR